MDYQNIIYEKRGSIAYAALNRPDELNALSDDLQLKVRHALEDAGWDSSPEVDEFKTIREKNGLKAALSWNAECFVNDDAWFKKSRDRG